MTLRIKINHLNPYDGDSFLTRWKVFEFKGWGRLIIWTYLQRGDA